MKNSNTEFEEKNSDNRIENENKKHSGERYTKLKTVLAWMLSVVVALGIWLYVSTTLNVNANQEFDLIPIETKYTDKLAENDLVVQSMSFDTVNVNITGVKSALRTLDPADIEAYVDLSDITSPGEYQCQVKLNVPRGFAASTKSNDLVLVHVDKPATRVYEIDGNNVAYDSWTLTNDCSFDREKTTVNIDYVVIEGTTMDIHRVTSVKIRTNAIGVISSDVVSIGSVEFYDINGIRISGELYDIKTYSGGRLDAGGKLVNSVQVSDIFVNIRIIKEKEVPLTVKTEHGYFSDLRIEPASVIIKGSPAAVDAVNELNIGSINEKNVIYAGTEYRGNMTNVTLPDGISQITDTTGKEIDTTVFSPRVIADIGRTYTLRVPRTAITITGKDAVVEDEYLYVKVRLSGVDESVFRLLQANLDTDKGGLNVIANLTNVHLNDKTEVPVTLMFSADFEGKIYEIIEKGSSYKITVIKNEQPEQ